MDNNKRGFAGLADLASDIKDVDNVTNTTRIASPPLPPPKRHQPPLVKKHLSSRTQPKQQTQIEENNDLAIIIDDSAACPKCGMTTHVKKISTGFIQECHNCGNTEFFIETDKEKIAWLNKQLHADEKTDCESSPEKKLDVKEHESHPQLENLKAPEIESFSSAKTVGGLIAFILFLWFFGYLTHENQPEINDPPSQYANQTLEPPTSIDFSSSQENPPPAFEYKNSSDPDSNTSTNIIPVKKPNKAILHKKRINHQPVEAPAPERQYTGQEMAISLDKTEIRNAMSLLGQISGMIIIVDDDVHATVSLTVGKPEPWDKIFYKILADYQLGATFQGNTIQVFNKSQSGGSK